MSDIIMKETKNKLELLAPAGSFESLKAAVINGADAVYLGLGSFNARASASNFTLETLKDAVIYARLFGVKIYLTMNTLLKDGEIADAVHLVKQAWDIGISAVILQDFGFLQTLKSKHPEIVIHASTQMGVHNLHGVLAAKQMGIERVILSRETPLTEIRNIKNNCDIELEYFVHGALCCGFSGNCYFSSLVSGKSGNRGRCLQLCRKPYVLNDNKKSEQGYWLSTRDTMLARDLKPLLEAGICSFKIEGRMRRPEYVGEVTRIYRKAIDDVVTDADIDALKLMYNRGNFAKAHTFGVDNEIVYPALQSHMGIKLGYVKNASKSKAYLSCAVCKGDGLKFLRKGVETGHALVFSNGSETGFVGDVRQGDEVFLTDSAKKNDEINSRSRKLPLSINAEFSLDSQSCKVLLKSEGKVKEFFYSLSLETPKSSPVSQEDIKECLTSLGNTFFECKEISIKTDKEFFASKACLKGLRRDFIEDFEKFIISSFERPVAKNNNSVFEYFNKLLLIETPESCTIIMCNDYDARSFEEYSDYIVIKPADYKKLLADIKSNSFVTDNKYILNLPAVSFFDDVKLLQEIIETKAFDKYMVNNIYGLSLAYNSKIILGYKMNIIGSALAFPKIQSFENRYFDESDFVYVFGRPDIMQYVHCYYNLKRGCDRCIEKSSLILADDRGENYEIRKQKIANCYNLLISSLPLNLSEKSYKKRFIDAASISEEEKKSLIDYLKGLSIKIKTVKSLSIKPLD